MRIWSSNKASFVDFADGYSYLPFIPSNFGIKEQELLPEDLAVLFHEFSHQLSLKGPFGWLCAYFQAIRPIARNFSDIQANLEFPEISSSFSENLEKEKYYMELLGVETFYEIYGDCIANYVDLIECYRWVLEGIALFVQLDYKSSTQFDAASDLFYFAAELVKTEKYRGKKQMGLVDINEYINKARDSKFTSGLLQYILENTRPDTASYFLGYLMIKQIQRHLAKIDNRLLDPELFYIFVQNYFFLDSQLLDLCLVEPRYQYQKRVSCFLNETILVLMNVKAENLRVILDSICDYKNASINYLYMDFAAVIKKGLLKGWNDQQILDRFSERIKTYSNSLEQQEIFLDFRKTDQFRELSEAALQVSEFIFHLLRYTMLSYKLKHMHTAILGYNLYEESVTLTAVGVGGTPLRILMTIPFHEFLPLIKEAETGQYEIECNGNTRMPPKLYEAFSSLGWSAFSSLLSDYYKQNKLLIVQDYDLYLINGRERCRVWVKDDFLHVEPYHWEPNSTPNSIRSNADLQMLKWVGGFFHHSKYLEMIQIPRIMGGEQVHPDDEFIDKVLFELWKTVFNDSEVVMKDFISFGRQKCKIIFVTERERQLLKSLCENASVRFTHSNDVEAINRRWLYFTGQNLIVENRNDSTTTTAQFLF